MLVEKAKQYTMHTASTHVPHMQELAAPWVRLTLEHHGQQTSGT